MALFNEEELIAALKEIAPKKLGPGIMEPDGDSMKFIDTTGRYGNVTNKIIAQAVTWDKPGQF